MGLGEWYRGYVAAEMFIYMVSKRGVLRQGFWPMTTQLDLLTVWVIAAVSNMGKCYMIILSVTVKHFERLCMRGNIKIN